MYLWTNLWSSQANLIKPLYKEDTYLKRTNDWPSKCPLWAGYTILRVLGGWASLSWQIFVSRPANWIFPEANVLIYSFVFYFTCLLIWRLEPDEQTFACWELKMSNVTVLIGRNLVSTISAVQYGLPYLSERREDLAVLIGFTLYIFAVQM